MHPREPHWCGGYYPFSHHLHHPPSNEPAAVQKLQRRLFSLKACFVAKIYLLCRAPTILLSLPLWDRIYGTLWKPVGRVFAWQRCRGGNSYRQIGSFAVERTKQMGFRLGEIFSRKCVLNLAQVLTYAVSVLPASP